MEGWTTHLTAIVAILGSFAAIGLALDKLLLSHQRERLSNHALKYWIAVEETTIRDIPIAAARIYLSIVRLFVGEKLLSPSGLIRAMLVSVVVTTIVFLTGQFAGFYFAHQMTDDPSPTLELMQATWWAFQTHSHKSVIYPLNVVFDIMTILCTSFLIGYMYRHRGVTKRVPIILLDILIACTLFTVCFYILFHANNLYAAAGEWRTPAAFFELVKTRAGFGDQSIFDPFWMLPQLAFTTTIFYPTIIFLLVLLVITSMHIFALLTKKIGLQILELSSGNDKSIFFYTGTFLGLLVSVFSLFV